MVVNINNDQYDNNGLFRCILTSTLSNASSLFDVILTAGLDVSGVRLGVSGVGLFAGVGLFVVFLKKKKK